MLITIPALVPLAPRLCPYPLIPPLPYSAAIFSKVGFAAIVAIFCLSRSRGRVCKDVALRTSSVGFVFSRVSRYIHFWRHSELS